jgi:hypothetical protein
MSKFNDAKARPVGLSPIVSTGPALTHEGGAGAARDEKSELFLLAVANMVGEQTFYEAADSRDTRYAELVRQVATIDSDWIAGFLGWLRTGANMRSASLVGAAEATRALLAAGQPGGRQLVASVLQRADEPGEMLAYWTSKYGRALPKPVKRGVADAIGRLYTEYALLKYDTAGKGYRFADVIDLVHPSPSADWQGDLFQVALERRHNRGEETPLSLMTLVDNSLLRRRVADDPAVLLDSDRLKAAGMTWEDALSLAGSRVEKAKLWQALIPTMGYMALLRNLRNFDEAGVSDQVAETVGKRLADPEQVAKSRQFPMRFLSAYRAAPSLRWGYPLEQALAHSLANIPELPGRTLVLVDTSASMNESFSKDGTLKRWDAAVIFGVAFAQRCAAADVVSYSSAQRYWGDPSGALTKQFDLQRGESLLRSIERWKSGGYFLGQGTDTAGALRKHYAAHDRVVLITDEQAGSDPRGVSASMPAGRPLYTWNLAGYETGHAPSGPNRHTFGGLTDAAFRMVPLLEAGRNGAWPWENLD